MNSHNASRRLFLRHAGTMSSLLGAAAAPLALNLAAPGSAAAQGAADYKALVCLFLYGGNDAFNMVLPTDTASWAAYTAVRNQAPDSIALLAPGTAPNGRRRRRLAGAPGRRAADRAAQRAEPQLRAAPGAGRGADAVRQRPAAGHRCRTSARWSCRRPRRSTAKRRTRSRRSLFSHNDQQNTWQALGPEGATRGWGGPHGRPAGAARTAQPVFTADLGRRQRGVAGGRRRCSSTRSAATVRSAWASTATAASSARPTSARRCSASSPAPAARTCSNADLAAVAQALDRRRSRRCAPRCAPASDALFGTAPASGSLQRQPTTRSCATSNPLTGAGRGQCAGASSCRSWRA